MGVPRKYAKSLKNTCEEVSAPTQVLFKNLAEIKSYFYLYILYSPADIYLFKVNNQNTRPSTEVCLKLTLQTPE